MGWLPSAYTYGKKGVNSFMMERKQEVSQADTEKPNPSSTDDRVVQNPSEDMIIEVDPATLLPNPYQVRLPGDAFDPSFDQLVESIRNTGLIELPIVRETENGPQITAGHRRVAACIKLGLKSIKCILRHLTDEQMAEVNLDENLRRKTLNPIEETRGYANFRDHFKRSEQWIADRFGVSRDIVAQRLRLLTFPQPIQDLVAKGLLTPSHAEAIAMAPADRQLQLAQIVVEKRLSVKRTTAIAKESVELERANQEALKNIALRNNMVDARLARLDEAIARHESILAWFEFHEHPWKAESCGHNIGGVCSRFSWESEPVTWTTRLGGVARFQRSEDGRWHVEACSAVCAHCDLYRARTTYTSQS